MYNSENVSYSYNNTILYILSRDIHIHTITAKCVTDKEVPKIPITSGIVYYKH